MSRIELCYLMNHLAADGTSGASDEDSLTLEHLGDGCGVDDNLVTRKQVFNLHILESILVKFLLWIPLLFLVYHQDFYLCLDEFVYQLFVITEVIRL